MQSWSKIFVRRKQNATFPPAAVSTLYLTPLYLTSHRACVLWQCMDGACMRGGHVAHGFGCVCVPQVMGRGAPMGVCAACICGIELMR